MCMHIHVTVHKEIRRKLRGVSFLLLWRNKIFILSGSKCLPTEPSHQSCRLCSVGYVGCFSNRVLASVYEEEPIALAIVWVFGGFYGIPLAKNMFRCNSFLALDFLFSVQRSPAGTLLLMLFGDSKFRCLSYMHIFK